MIASRNKRLLFQTYNAMSFVTVSNLTNYKWMVQCGFPERDRTRTVQQYEVMRTHVSECDDSSSDLAMTLMNKLLMIGGMGNAHIQSSLHKQSRSRLSLYNDNSLGVRSRQF